LLLGRGKAGGRKWEDGKGARVAMAVSANLDGIVAIIFTEYEGIFPGCLVKIFLVTTGRMLLIF
jgi:hypothetical protein